MNHVFVWTLDSIISAMMIGLLALLGLGLLALLGIDWCIQRAKRILRWRP